MSDYNAEETATLARAFNVAWSKITEASAALGFDVERARTDLSKAVIKLAEAGERNERRLAVGALRMFRQQQVQYALIPKTYGPSARSVDLWEQVP